MQHEGAFLLYNIFGKNIISSLWAICILTTLFMKIIILNSHQG